MVNSLSGSRCAGLATQTYPASNRFVFERGLRPEAVPDLRDADAGLRGNHMSKSGKQYGNLW